MARQRGVHDIDDLQGRCRVDEITGCWTWAGGLNSTGQPSMRIPALGGKSGGVGSLLSALIGPPGRGRFWISHCGNQLCCNPTPRHRWPGTRSKQMRTASPTRTLEQRARIAQGRKTHSRVTEADVDDIRSGRISSREAADRLGITTSYAWAIRVGKSRAFCAAPAPGASVFTWRPA